MSRTIPLVLISLILLTVPIIQSCKGSDNGSGRVESRPVAPSTPQATHSAAPLSPPPEQQTHSQGSVQQKVAHLHELVRTRNGQLTPAQRDQVHHYDLLSMDYIRAGQQQEGIRCLDIAISILENPDSAGNPYEKTNWQIPGNHQGMGGGYEQPPMHAADAMDPYQQAPRHGEVAWAEQAHPANAPWAQDPYQQQPPPGDNPWDQTPQDFGQAPPPPHGNNPFQAAQHKPIVDDKKPTDWSRPVSFTRSAPLVTGPYANSPFGFHPLGTKGAAPYRYARDLDIHWERCPLYFFWFLIQPDINSRQYDWGRFDQLVSLIPPDIHTVWNITVAPPPVRMNGDPHTVRGSHLPSDKDAYTAFVRAVVERYDGDGDNDMPGLKSPIKYWQVDNEPALVTGETGFPELVRITRDAIKQADPEAKVIIGGVPGFNPVSQYLSEFDSYYAPILKELGGQGFDIFDFHYFGTAQGDYKDYKRIVAHMRDTLTASGFPSDMEIWCTETGTYTGSPRGEGLRSSYNYPRQSEQDQAADMLKRFVVGLRSGIRRMFWAWGMVEGFQNTGGVFDTTGVVKPTGEKKLAYYTCKLMVEKLDTVVWNQITPLREDQDGVFLYRMPRSGNDVYVMWKDNAQPGQPVTFGVDELNGLQTVLATAAVTDASGTPRQKTLEASDGAFQLDLSVGPVFLESGQ